MHDVPSAAASHDEAMAAVVAAGVLVWVTFDVHMPPAQTPACPLAGTEHGEPSGAVGPA